MTRDDLRITAHAAIRMAERMIDSEEVILVLLTGEVIESYPQDRLLPSRLQLAWVAGRPLHVVSAPDGERVIIITVYDPTEYPAQWSPDFRRRIQ